LKTDPVNSLFITGKRIDIDKADILLEYDFSSGKAFLDDWTVIGDSSWEIKDGMLEI